MVSPSPELQRKIRNTKSLIKENKSHLISDFSKKEPHNYIDQEHHNKLELIKPWIEKTKPKKKYKHQENNKSKNIQSLQPSIHDNILVICVDFSDRPATQSISKIQNIFFSDTYNFRHTFRNYFKENSYNTYIPEGSVHGWYRAPQPSSYYTNGNYGWGAYPNNVWKLVEDVVDLISNDPSIKSLTAS